MSFNAGNRKFKRHSKEVRKAVVRDIRTGTLLIEEAMVRYGVLSPKTIKKWLKEALEQENCCLESITG